MSPTSTTAERSALLARGFRPAYVCELGAECSECAGRFAVYHKADEERIVRCRVERRADADPPPKKPRTCAGCGISTDEHDDSCSVCRARERKRRSREANQR
jgi:hypothetical protein